MFLFSICIYNDLLVFQAKVSTYQEHDGMIQDVAVPGVSLGTYVLVINNYTYVFRYRMCKQGL